MFSIYGNFVGERISSILDILGFDFDVNHTTAIFELAEIVTSATQQLSVNSYIPEIDEDDQDILYSPIHLTETLQRLQNLEK